MFTPTTDAAEKNVQVSFNAPASRFVNSEKNEAMVKNHAMTTPTALIAGLLRLLG